MRKLAARERFSYRGARDALAFHLDCVHLFHRERLRVGPQQRKIAHATLAETEIIAHEDPARVQPALEDILDKSRRLERRKPRIEARDHGGMNTVGREQSELAPQARQTRRRTRRCEELPRMRIEGHDRRHEVQVFSCLDEPCEHPLMAAMHAVEVADGERERLLGIGVEMTGDAHESLRSGPTSPRCRGK